LLQPGGLKDEVVVGSIDFGLTSAAVAAALKTFTEEQVAHPCGLRECGVC
jgi:hypothetical protein